MTVLHESTKNISPKFNDAYEWVEHFQESKNEDNWGLADTEIEFEII